MPFTNSLLAQHGVHTAKARTVTSTEALPGWLAHFYASTPAESGCATDARCDAPPEVDGTQSLVDVLVDYGYAVELCAEGAALSEALRDRYPVKRFGRHTRDMMNYGLDESVLPQTDRRLVLFHFDAVQHVAHAHGYDSDIYHAQVLCLDWQLQQLVHALWQYWPQRTTFVLISDHGGSGYQHTTFDVQSLQVPLGMWGYGIAQGVDLFTKAVDTTQMAPTLLEALGYDIPASWLHPPIRRAHSSDGCTSTVLRANSTVVIRERPPTVCPVPQDFAHHNLRTLRNIVVAGFLVAMAAQAGLGYLKFNAPTLVA